ncbi:hypothetical protein ACLB1G_22295 [Oxalobacteraceae bacterium A2-2]
MSESTLDPDNIPLGNDRILGRGHGTGALGPSDTSDSGSDVAGGTSLARDDDDFVLEQGTSEDGGSVPGAIGSGPDLGDADLDSDTDATGTGERGAAGRDNAALGADIGFDHIETMPIVDEGFKEGEVERAWQDGAGDGNARDADGADPEEYEDEESRDAARGA